MHSLAGEFEAAIGVVVGTVSAAATKLEAASTLTQTAESTEKLLRRWRPRERGPAARGRAVPYDRACRLGCSHRTASCHLLGDDAGVFDEELADRAKGPVLQCDYADWSGPDRQINRHDPQAQSLAAEVQR